MGYDDMVELFSDGRYIGMIGKNVTDKQEEFVKNKIRKWLKDCPIRVTTLKIDWNQGGLDNLHYIGVNCVVEKEIN